MSETGLDPRVERVFEGLDNHDADIAADQFAADGRYHEVPRGEAFSREEFREYLADELFVTFPDYTVEGTQVFTTADWATTVQWSFSGTHEGEAGWFDPTGKSVTLSIVSVVTVSEEGITSWRDFFDLDELSDQLGRE